MRFPRIALASLALVVSAACNADNTTSRMIEHPPVFGRTPPGERWIWYAVVGPRDRVAPIVYISTQHFETVLPEALIVVSRVRYDIIARFAQSRLTQGSCPFEVEKPLPYYAVKIVEHHDGRTSSCVLSQESACENIANVMKLPGMKWSPAELEILHEFGSGDQCKSVLDAATMKR